MWVFRNCREDAIIWKHRTAKKPFAKFRHINRMMQDQTIRLMESVSNRHVGLFQHILTSKSEFSDKFRQLSRTFPTSSVT
jgi:hypothetical protein